MSKSDRLLQLLQILRSYKQPVVGQKLAERLGVSLRTLYRDISALQALGADIQGEAGVGYLLKPGFFIPPLMFNQSEIEALNLGMLWVLTFADPSLGEAAEVLLGKIKEVLPHSAKKSLEMLQLRVGPPGPAQLKKEDLSIFRAAMREGVKVRIDYRKNSEIYSYIVFPISIGYFNNGRIIVAWNESTREFQHFKSEKISFTEKLKQRSSERREVLFRRWHDIQLSSI